MWSKRRSFARSARGFQPTILWKPCIIKGHWISPNTLLEALKREVEETLTPSQLGQAFV